MKNLLIFFSILFLAPVAHTQDFRDNFVGDYLCTCISTDYFGNPPFISTGYINVSKDATYMNRIIVDCYRFSMVYSYILYDDSTYVSTWQGWYYYGHFISNDSIFLHARHQGATIWYQDECWGKKITTAIPANAPAIRIVATPNPADDFIHISLPLPGENRYQLINAQGKAVLNGNFTRNTRLDVSMLAPGFYVLRVAGNNWQSEEKIIIR